VVRIDEATKSTVRLAAATRESTVAVQQAEESAKTAPYEKIVADLEATF